MSDHERIPDDPSVRTPASWSATDGVFDLRDVPWTLRADRLAVGAPETARARAFVAHLPFVVHDALIAASVIDHPDVGFAEREQAWIGESDWTIAATFAPPPGAWLDADRIDLVIEDLDTDTIVALDGVPVARHESQFITLRCDVTGSFATGNATEHRIELRMRGPVALIEERVERFGDRPVNGDWTAYPYMRRSACSLGWDWGPRTASCGFASARIEAWSIARLRSIRPLVTVARADSARIEVRVDLERAPGRESVGLHVDASLVEPAAGDRTPRHFEASAHVEPGSTTATLIFEFDDPVRWWPRDLGEPALHRLDVVLRDGDGVERGRDAVRVGVRSVTLDTSEEPDGGRPLRVLVNDRAVNCRGANWIPTSPFPRLDADALLEARLSDALEANMNMVRVWGGGLYERDRLYEWCDEHGMLVWQDFMFACATYPEEEPFRSLVELEAREQVARLSRHASVAFWCGGNEDVLAWFSWGFGPRLRAGQTWGLRYWKEWLPAIVDEIDPTRPYLVESPWSGSEHVDPNDPDRIDRHVWDLRVERVREQVPRFASEFGHQAPPAQATYEEVLAPSQRRIGSESMRHRQRGHGGDAEQIEPWREAWCTPPRDFAAWIWQCQLVQARALAISFAWYRANAPRCSGALVWQLNDVWRAPTWALVDAAGRRRPAWYTVRSLLAPRRLLLEPVGGELSLVLVDDRAVPSFARARVRRVDFDGRVLAESVLRLDAPEGARAVVAALPAELVMPAAAHEECLLAELVDEAEEEDGGAEARATWFFGRDRLLSYREATFDFAARRLDDGVVRIDASASTVVRDAFLAVDRLGPLARVDVGMRTLLPGEVVTFHVAGLDDVPEIDRVRAAMRSANDVSDARRRPGGHG